MAVSQQDVLKALDDMSVMDLIHLTKDLEAKWGVEAKPQVVAQQLQKQENKDVRPVQTEFTVSLISFPADKKIAMV